MTIETGARVSFNFIDQLPERFSEVDFPIELALPWLYRKYWLSVEGRISEIIDFFVHSQVRVLTLHATQGRITEEDFLSWGSLTVEIARALGVKNITVHPNKLNRKKKEKSQEKVEDFIRRMEGGEMFSIETFTSKKRVFTPEEVINWSLPMTLDTSHIHSDRRVFDIIDNYSSKIRAVHLSGRDGGHQHLPVDGFCLEVVESLANRNWSGPVILEYLPQYHDRLAKDVKKVEEHVKNLKGGS